MKKMNFLIKSVLILVIGICFVSGYAQKGSISSEKLEYIKKISWEGISADQQELMINAISSNDIKVLSKNRSNIDVLDHEYKYKVDVKGITDQKSSGRCWLFTGLNTIRPKVMDKYNLSNFDFSQNYSFFFDQFEKSNLFLEGIIATAGKEINDRKVEWLFKNALSDGGAWTGFADVVKKYGVVPKSVMPESFHSNQTRMMNMLIKRRLREGALVLRTKYSDGESVEKLREEKVEILGDVYRILTVTLGVPPEEFEWRYKDADGNISELKKYTPKSFYKEAVGEDMDEYVLFMDDPSREYYKLYEIEFDKNMKEGRNWWYINIPAEVIKVFAQKSIIDNEAMYFSCDVGKQLDSKTGTLDLNNYDYESLVGVKSIMNKKERIQTFESMSAHGMALVGVDVDVDEKPKKWLLENSWGSSSGHKGYLSMTDEWFDEYMFRLVVKKQYVSEEVLKILKQKPILLPPWDPMFAPEN